MPGIVLTDLTRDKPVTDRRPCLRLPGSVIPLVANSWLFYSFAHHKGWCPIAPDSALMPRLGWLYVLARCIRSLASYRNRPYSSSRCLWSRNRVLRCHKLLLLRGCQQLTHSARLLTP